MELPWYSQYTKLNLIFFLIILPFSNPTLNTFLLTNTTSVCLSYYASYLFDSTIFDRHRNKFAQSRLRWHINDIIGHWIPLIICYLVIPIDTRPQILALAGTLSATTHLLWCAIVQKTLYMNEAYVDLPDCIWHKLWIFAMIGHFLPFIVSILGKRPK